jgi:ubiquinone/menaquinone biosynthesis C-methylase UbiE
VNSISENQNIDQSTVDGFGEEWSAYDQISLNPAELQNIFDQYFSIFPFERLPPDAEGFDLGCGSGRWADRFSKQVGLLHCIDPSQKALAVARRRMEGRVGLRFHLAGSDDIPLADNSQDFGYSLGVLHHIPDTARALADCTRKLKAGAPFLVYLYYRFDNRPLWFRMLWQSSELGRLVISRLPFGLRKVTTILIASLIYWPLARTALLLERLGLSVSAFPLGHYRRFSFYTMRTDALDRFGTRLEQRFTRNEIAAMMAGAGLADIQFRESEPFWVACGIKTAG